MIEVNALVETLRHQRLGALEATTLLRKVMAEIDVAVFTFDEDQRAEARQPRRRAAARQPRGAAARPARPTELGLGDCLDRRGAARHQHGLPRRRRAAGRSGAAHFRQGGRPHELLVLSDLSQPLREEERQAWQRLIRVLGHEMNNSLAPIKSIAGSLSTIVEREPPPADWRDDMQRGLAVIASRSESLSRFMSAYARLAKLPPPQARPARRRRRRRPRRHAREGRTTSQVAGGPRLTIQGDGDQLEQLLINLVRNAVDAVARDRRRRARRLAALAGSSPPTMELWVEDEGPGLSNTGNLFVPFFTTKPAGRASAWCSAGRSPKRTAAA